MAALTGIALLSPNLEGAAPSRTYTYSAGNVISPDEVTTNEDNVYTYLQTGVDTYKDLSIETADLAGSAVTNAKIGANAVTTDKVSDGTLVGDDLVNDTLDAEELDETDDYTWTGAHDFGGATIEIDNQADCSGVTTLGQICLDSDDGVLYGGTGAAAQQIPDSAANTLTYTTAAAEGTDLTYIRTDASIAVFDATSPASIDLADTATVGTAAFAARRDHQHALNELTSHAQTTTVNDNSLRACANYDPITANVSVTATASPVIISVNVGIRGDLATDDALLRIDRDDGTPSAGFFVFDVPATNPSDGNRGFTWIDDPGAGVTTYNLEGCVYAGNGITVDRVDFDVVALP